MSISKTQLRRIKELADSMAIARLQEISQVNPTLVEKRVAYDAVQFASDQFNRYLRKLLHAKSND